MVVGSLTVEADVVVIGAGPGGYVAAIRAAQLGKSVTLVENNPPVGGVCLNRGCIPSKAFIHAADSYSGIKKLDEIGISVKGASVDMKKLVSWKDGIVKGLVNGVKGLLEKNGVEVITGKAVFTGKESLRIEGKSDVNKVLFKNAIIATGSHPVEIPVFPFSDNNIIRAGQALSLDKVPKSLVVIGGGYIGTELGSVFSSLGSKVSIIEMADRIMPMVPSILVKEVETSLLSSGVSIFTKSAAKGISKKEGKNMVLFEQEGKEKEIEADKVLVAVGRRSNSKDIGLEEIGVKTDDKGFIIVDESQRTSVRNIFAIGDVAGEPMLAHKAFYQGKVASEVISGVPSAFDPAAIPFAVYTSPEIASVGLTEEEAIKEGFNVDSARFPFKAIGRALTLQSPEGFVQWIVDKDNRTVLGCHAVGVGVADLISEAALAIELGASMEDVSKTIHPHPTLSESLMEAADAVLGNAVHIFKKK